VLPVTVTDRSGRFVADLPQQAFAVSDNGRRQSLAFFTSEDTPVSIGLIVDNSLSMRKKTGEVVAATMAFARSSNPQDEIFALEFNDSVHEALKDHWFLLSRDVEDLQRAVSSMLPEGRTALYDAVALGLEKLSGGSRARKVLVVISDGGDNASGTTLERVLARARHSDAEIYTIGLFDPDDTDSNPGVLKTLARETGGERFLPESPGLLLQACERIAHEIRSGYTVAYEPPAHDGAYHRVEVSVERPGSRLNVRTRPGYYAAGR
jgi:VWFA-related protein